MPLNSPRQLKMSLSLNRDNFFVSDSNRKAAVLIDIYPAWDTAAVIIVGDKGSGKTHLANILRAKDGNIAIFEDIDRNLDENALFSALNEPGRKILITSRIEPSALDIGTPDLRSRLSAQICVKIDVPDDNLIRAIVMKRLNDNRMYIGPKSLSHIVKYAERSFAFIGNFTESVMEIAADQLEKKRKGLLLVPLKTVKDILTTLKQA